jgi:protein ImuB
LYACVYQPPVPDLPAAGAADPGTSGTSGTSATYGTFRTPGTPGAPGDPGNPENNVALVRIAADFSPRFEVHRDDLVAIDVSGLGRLLGAPRAIGDALRRTAAERGLRVHVAIAGTRTAALVLAQARPGLTLVEPGEEASAVAPIPVRMLERVPDGEGERTRLRSCDVSVLKTWGLNTLGELAAIPRADLSARLGPQGLVWHAIARGEDVRPLVPTLEAERFESSQDLEWPIEGLEPLSFVLTRLLEPLSTRLERRDRAAAVLHVVLRLVTRDTVTRSLQLPSPIRDMRTLRTLALLDLESHPPAAAIDRVQIVIDPTPGRVLQHTLFSRPHPTAEQISTLLARLGALMGQDRIGAPAVVDSYRPGAFAMTRFKTDHESTSGASGSVAADRRPASRLPPESRFPAPALRSPDPASRLLSALRRCRQPVPARVTVAGGRPARVTTDRRGFDGGLVLQCAGPWRTSGEWWSVAPLRSERSHQTAWNRDEWDVALGDGAVYRIFRDRDTDRWFIDAIVD